MQDEFYLQGSEDHHSLYKQQWREEWHDRIFTYMYDNTQPCDSHHTAHDDGDVADICNAGHAFHLQVDIRQRFHCLQQP